MSDTPGGNFHPRDRRRNERQPGQERRPVPHGGAPPRPPQHEAPAAAVPRPGKQRARKEKKRRQQLRREAGEPQRQPKGRGGARQPSLSTLTLGQKLLRLLTLGLLRPRRPSAGPLRLPAAEPPKNLTTPVPPSSPDDISGTRLHVGNLHDEIEEEDLLDLFKGVGPVRSVDVVYCSRTYRSRGEGFVEFMAVEDARRAVEELHGQLYMRRPLILGPAKPRGTDEREKDTADNGGPTE